MKFTIDKNTLLTKLQLLSKAIPARTTLPIISNALFTIKMKVVTLILKNFNMSFFSNVFN